MRAAGVDGLPGSPMASRPTGTAMAPRPTGRSWSPAATEMWMAPVIRRPAATMTGSCRRPDPGAGAGDVSASTRSRTAIEALRDGLPGARRRRRRPRERGRRHPRRRRSRPPSGSAGRSGTPPGCCAPPMPEELADALDLPPMVARNEDRATDRLHRLRRRPARRRPPASAPPTGRRPLRLLADPATGRATWSGPVTCSRCGPATAGCWSGAGTPRPRSTCAGWPGCRRSASSPRSSRTTASP